MDKQDLFETAIVNFGVDAQKAMAIEECAELINALCKEKRGRATDADIVTEIADVRIMCEQLALIYGTDDVDAEQNRKTERLFKRLQDNGYIAKDEKFVIPSRDEWIHELPYTQLVIYYKAIREELRKREDEVFERVDAALAAQAESTTN